ncbi:MAG TPA: hypothetical protein VD930_05160 [Gemmatimonadales bacterium]|nr:hypothetical protein [Gemmatimonadales bacterium]
MIRQRLLLSLIPAALGCDDGAEPSRAAVQIQAVSAVEFAGTPLDTVGLPLAIKVTDFSDRPVWNAKVNWSTADGGTLLPLSEVTDQHGIAQAIWVLGWRTGSQQARASVVGIDSAAVFSADAQGFRAIGVGTGDADHMCAIDPDGALYCWGPNASGQLGDGTVDSGASPRPVMLPEPAAQVVLDEESTCARTQSGQVYCWGKNNAGQLGNGTLTGSFTPVPVALPEPAKFITARSWGACAITVVGDAYCWGFNSKGRFGIGTMDDIVPTPARVLGGFSWRDLRLGLWRACGIREDGQVYCWGDPEVEDGLGTGADTTTTSPLPVTNAPAADSVGISGHIQCSIAATGQTHCWGHNWTIGVEDPREWISDPIPLGTPLRSMHSLHRPVVALGTDARGYWWGARPTASAADQYTPAPFTGELHLSAIGAGGPGVCGIEATTSAVYCWTWDGPSWPALDISAVPAPP